MKLERLEDLFLYQYQGIHIETEAHTFSDFGKILVLRNSVAKFLVVRGEEGERH